jgi:Uma2 family endonuclease
VAAEVISPDDRYEDIVEKLADYQTLGVPHIWLLNPKLKSFSIYRDGSLTATSALALPGYGILISPVDIFR